MLRPMSWHRILCRIIAVKMLRPMSWHCSAATCTSSLCNRTGSSGLCGRTFGLQECKGLCPSRIVVVCYGGNATQNESQLCNLTRLGLRFSRGRDAAQPNFGFGFGIRFGNLVSSNSDLQFDPVGPSILSGTGRRAAKFRARIWNPNRKSGFFGFGFAI